MICPFCQGRTSAGCEKCNPFLPQNPYYSLVLRDYERGRLDERKRILEYVKEYREAYAEDLFEPIKPGEKDPISRERVAGHIARFILDNIIIKKLTEKEPGDE